MIGANGTAPSPAGGRVLPASIGFLRYNPRVSNAAIRADSDVLTALTGEIDQFLSRTLRSRGLPGMLEEAICNNVGAAHGVIMAIIMSHHIKKISAE